MQLFKKGDYVQQIGNAYRTMIVRGYLIEGDIESEVKVVVLWLNGTTKMEKAFHQDDLKKVKPI